ncbi:uncharacterized protein [Lolium perenne]|uniref:uncharacterized protein n=1 Tax=Lolium perenne TaxID=4522 RepID=UPI003A998101
MPKTQGVMGNFALVFYLKQVRGSTCVLADATSCSSPPLARRRPAPSRPRCLPPHPPPLPNLARSLSLSLRVHDRTLTCRPPLVVVAPSIPAPSRDHRSLCLASLSLLVEGIDAGGPESTPLHRLPRGQRECRRPPRRLQASPGLAEPTTALLAPEVEEDIVEEGGLSEPLKERRSKAARDRAPPSDTDTRTGEVPSTEAVMRVDGATESRHPPPSSLTFTELHTALGEAHVAEIKRLTALVEEAAQKNRKLIALGTEAQAKALAEAREGFVKESFYREAEFRAQQAEEARKRAKAEVAELTKVLEQKGRELEDVITEYKVKLEAATDARDSARGAAASLREEVAALKQQHAKELAAEKEASEGIVLAVQAEKTNFEAFVREMSRQILGKFLLSHFLFYLPGV